MTTIVKGAEKAERNLGSEKQITAEKDKPERGTDLGIRTE